MPAATTSTARSSCASSGHGRRRGRDRRPRAPSTVRARSGRAVGDAADDRVRGRLERRRQSQSAPIATRRSPSSSSRSGAEDAQRPEEERGQDDEPDAELDPAVRSAAMNSAERLRLLRRRLRGSQTPRRPARARPAAAAAERDAATDDRCDAAEHRPEERADDRGRHRRPDQLAAPCRRAPRRRATRAPAVHANALAKPWTKRARSSTTIGSPSRRSIVVTAIISAAGDASAPAEPRRGEPARDAADERAGRVRACEDSGARLREAELVGVVGQQRRQRREEHRVDEDDPADEEQQPALTPSVGPGGLSPLEESAEAVLALVARPHPRRELGECATVARIRPHQPLRLPHGFGARGEQFRDHVAPRRVAISLTRPIRKRSLGAEALAGEQVTARCSRPDLRRARTAR